MPTYLARTLKKARLELWTIDKATAFVRDNNVVLKEAFSPSTFDRILTGLPTANVVICGDDIHGFLDSVLSAIYVMTDVNTEMCIDLESQAVWNTPSVGRIPVNQILNTYNFYNWVRHNTNNDADKQAANDIAASIRNYKFPVYVLPNESEHMIEEFLR